MSGFDGDDASREAAKRMSVRGPSPTQGGALGAEPMAERVRAMAKELLASICADGGEERFISDGYDAHDRIVDGVVDICSAARRWTDVEATHVGAEPIDALLKTLNEMLQIGYKHVDRAFMVKVRDALAASAQREQEYLRELAIWGQGQAD